jgi:adenylate kinase
MPTKIVIITGLSGAGKTTLLDAIPGRRYRVVTIGTLMEKDGIEKGFVKNRDELKTLDHKRFNRLRRDAYAQFSKIKGDLILDTHTTIEKEPKLEPALPLSFIKGLNIRAFIYVNASSEEIMARREKDSRLRPRERQSYAALDIQRIVDLSILGYLSTHINAPLYIINNGEGRIGAASKELSKAVAESFSD